MWREDWKEHNNRKNKATRYILPVELVFYQKYSSEIDAKRIEYRLKKLKRKDIIDKIIKEGLIKMEL